MKAKYVITCMLLCGGIAHADNDIPSFFRGEYKVESLTWPSFEALKVAADRGDPKAMYTLAWAYDEGLGVSENDKTAESWYINAHAALVNLANKGDGLAMVMLGDMYKEGLGVKEDEAVAVQWYRKSADAGNAEGLCRLAACYEEGNGVPKDKETARALYQKAIDKGNNRAKDKLKELID